MRFEELIRKAAETSGRRNVASAVNVDADGRTTVVSSEDAESPADSPASREEETGKTP